MHFGAGFLHMPLRPARAYREAGGVGASLAASSVGAKKSERLREGRATPRL